MWSNVYTARRALIWSNVRDLKSRFAVWVATASGAGLFPVAPGTMGSLAGLPLAYFTQGWDLSFRLLFWLGLTALGTWSAKRFDEMMGTQDNQNIVIDEVIGMGITAWTAGHDLKTWIAAFVLFRIFDVLKPPPVRQVDQWSKKRSSSWWQGWGVIADDVIAGGEALGVVLLLQRLQVLS